MFLLFLKSNLKLNSSFSTKIILEIASVITFIQFFPLFNFL